ncbi:hypothetical protein GF359_00280 [candidate division WOR-3 bacterium]|uniref:Uncharacterized protein n=1 Tax=candidate division WOR-3 bacterium TaxID=2052148 RepID=A0A9D5QBM4_UNCW3|nr:hypothetical protein [candidate division WOR-3 bacterium]MBD3363629.1 hypothetical protein [candidate division WOR-3 bacterium]
MKRLTAISIISFILLAAGCGKNTVEYEDLNLWSEEGCFHQETVDVSEIEDGIIKAELNSKWHSFELQKLPGDFINWSFGKRLETFERFRNRQPPELSGPHNGMVATYGVARDDSRFRINNAVKGMGWLPRKEKLAEIIELLEQTIDDDFTEKLDRLDSLYSQGADIYDPTCQISLELYADPEFQTGTFLNQMVNPSCAVVFLDIPSYEFKAIAHLMHPDDPGLTEQQRLQVKYANLIHSYFHGHFDKTFIAVVYYVVEVFDNSPGKPEAKGQRIVPPMP